MDKEIQKEISVVNKLAAARAVLAATGKTPHELGKESLRKTLDWVNKFGFSSAGVINSLINRTTGGYAQKLVQKGFLVGTKTQSGVPNMYFTLSQMGLSEVERHATSLMRYPEIDPYRVNQQLIRHDLLAQAVTVNALNSGLASDFYTERMMNKDGDKSTIKRPDVAWMSKGKLIGVEIELSAKWGRDLDHFVFEIICALESTEISTGRFNRFVIASDSPAILNRYESGMQPNANLNIWEKNSRGHWAIEEAIKVPNWLIEKVDFRLIG